MTAPWLRSSLQNWSRSAASVALAALCGCGSSDGTLPIARERPPVVMADDQADAGESSADAGANATVLPVQSDAAAAPAPAAVDAAGFDVVARVDAATGKDVSPPPVTPSCSAETCKGCCRDGVCEQGVATDACGVLGNACSVCPNNFMCTTRGECRPDIDPKAKWRVQPVQTRIADAPAAGSWDAGDDKTPDVMVFVDCGKGGAGIADAPDVQPKFEFDARTGESSSLMPMWSTLEWGDCTLDSMELLAAPLRFRVFDNDSGFWGLVSEKDAITGVLTHQVTASDLAYGGFALPAVGLLSAPLEVRFVSK